MRCGRRGVVSTAGFAVRGGCEGVVSVCVACSAVVVVVGGGKGGGLRNADAEAVSAHPRLLFAIGDAGKSRSLGEAAVQVATLR